MVLVWLFTELCLPHFCMIVYRTMLATIKKNGQEGCLETKKCKSCGKKKTKHMGL